MELKIAMVMMPSWNVETPPVASAYLSTYLRHKNYEVNAFDFNIDMYNRTPKEKRYLFDGNKFNYWYPEENFNQVISKELDILESIQVWADKIINSRMDIICFSTYYSNYLSSLALANEIKKRDAGKIIIFGGSEADRYENGYEFIKKDYIDIVVIGEGELVLENIMKAMRNKGDIKNIKGILYKEGGRVYDNLGLDIEDIDRIPFPTFEDFNLSDYASEMLPILASRGCVNYCKFCGAWPFWKYRSRKAENIFEEIKYLKDHYNVNKFDIIDASINGDIKQLEKLCDLFIAGNAGVYWGGKACIRQEMTDDFLKKMYAAGCRWLSYGIESGSQEILKAMGKNFEVELAQEVLKNTYRNKINIATFFIIGFPGETRMDFIKTLWFIIKNRRYIGSISSGQKCGIPRNSILYRNAQKYGIRFESEGWHSPNNSPRERELRHKIFKAVNKLIFLKIVHA